MGKCSLMFAYVRLCSLYGRKIVAASDGERNAILQNARPTEMGTRGTRPSKYQRQRLARTNLDFGRARWLRENAERMNGKAKGLSDRNTFFICDTDQRGLGLEENLRLSSLIPAYSRLSSLNGKKNVSGGYAAPPPFIRHPVAPIRHSRDDRVGTGRPTHFRRARPFA